MAGFEYPHKSTTGRSIISPKVLCSVVAMVNCVGTNRSVMVPANMPSVRPVVNCPLPGAANSSSSGGVKNAHNSL